jgi:hypothetical protein
VLSECAQLTFFAFSLHLDLTHHHSLSAVRDAIESDKHLLAAVLVS